jgi:hypothetical protein
VHALHPWGQGEVAVTSCSAPVRILCDDPFLRAASFQTEAGLGLNAPALDVWSVADLLATGAAFHEADRIWTAPLMARLRDGEITSAQLHLKGRVFEVRAPQRWRVWRKTRPWWEVFG